MNALKKLLKYSKDDSLIRDSLLLIIATSGLSLSGFMFHFFMGRFLGPSSYGVLGVIFSLFYFFIVATQVVQTTITNFVARFNTNREKNKINSLLYIALKKTTIISIILTIIFLIFSPVIASFLNIPLKYLFIMSGLIILSFILPVTRGILQGLQKFKALGINMTIEGVTKLLLGILFVIMGFGVGGAIFALILSYAIPFILSFYPLKEYMTNKKEIIDLKEVYKYTLPVIISLLIFTGFYTIDVLLVKHFFTEQKAGLYVALSFLGKIILFGTQSIALVLFPKSVANFTKNKTNKKIVSKAMAIAAILGGIGVLAYFILPKLAITILYGKDYLPISGALGLYGLFMLVLSLCYVLIFYNLSLNKTGFNYILLTFFIMETILLYFNHTDILSITLMLLTISIVMFITLLLYTYNDKTINNNTSL